jgi:hypothetical protein
LDHSYEEFQVVIVTNPSFPGITVTAHTKALADAALTHRLEQLEKILAKCPCPICIGKTPVNQHDDDGSTH